MTTVHVRKQGKGVIILWSVTKKEGMGQKQSNIVWRHLWKTPNTIYIGTEYDLRQIFLKKIPNLIIVATNNNPLKNWLTCCKSFLQTFRCNNIWRKQIKTFKKVEKTEKVNTKLHKELSAHNLIKMFTCLALLIQVNVVRRPNKHLKVLNDWTLDK